MKALRKLAGGQMFSAATLTVAMGYATGEQAKAEDDLRALRRILLPHGVLLTDQRVGWVMRRA